MRFEHHDCSDIPGTLAIDTSTGQAGLAFSTPAGVYTHSWPADRAQTTTVLPWIDRMVHEAGMQPTDITGLVVATGPGTFTGLRVGLSIAKGIVAARDVPIVGIPTVEIVFAQHPECDIIAVLPAGRGRIVWQRRGDAPVNASIGDLLPAVGDSILVGELTDDQQAVLSDAGVRFEAGYRDPAVLLELGATRLKSGEVDDPVTLEPTYLHGVTVSSGPVQDRLKK